MPALAPVPEMPHVPFTTDLVTIMALCIAVGGLAVGWGTVRVQDERSWIGAAVGLCGLLLVVYALGAAIFGWPPMGWLRE